MTHIHDRAPHELSASLSATLRLSDGLTMAAEPKTSLLAPLSTPTTSFFHSQLRNSSIYLLIFQEAASLLEPRGQRRLAKGSTAACERAAKRLAHTSALIQVYCTLNPVATVLSKLQGFFLMNLATSDSPCRWTEALEVAQPSRARCLTPHLSF